MKDANFWNFTNCQIGHPCINCTSTCSFQKTLITETNESMKIDLHAGQRVLYKRNGIWRVGTLPPGSLNLTTEGLFANVFDVQDKTFEKNVNVNNLYLDGFELDEWTKTSEYCMPKADFIEFMHSDDFIQNAYVAYVSDGEYAYYPVNKFHENWINKQPFDFIVWGT